MLLVAFHGKQGSGKDACAKMCTDALVESFQMDPNSIAKFGIKDCFNPFVLPLYKKITEGYGDKSIPTTPEGLRVLKNLQRSISTFGETFVDPLIWSLQYEKGVQERSEIPVLLTADIRTPQNLDSLIRISESRKVILFHLHAPEEVRKARVSTWREGESYTEQDLKSPTDLPSDSDFTWIDLDTSEDPVQTFAQIHSTLSEHLDTEEIPVVLDKEEDLLSYIAFFKRKFPLLLPPSPYWKPEHCVGGVYKLIVCHLKKFFPTCLANHKDEHANPKD